jgi:hypothetical protein
MRHRISAIAIVLLLIASGLTVLASSGWTPQGNSESQPEVYRAHILTAPIISAYGYGEPSDPAGSTMHIWCTYSDAENDTPSYVRLVRSAIPTPVQTTTYAMIANDSSNNYVVGKKYHYDWTYFPFIGLGWIQIQVKSGADAQVIKNIVEYQAPLVTLTRAGVSPMSDQPGDYVFFVNYTNLFNYFPNYVRVNINGTDHEMTKNYSGSTAWAFGVSYHYNATGLTPGNYTYSFHTQPSTGYQGDITSGAYWFIIQEPGTTSISFGMMLLVAVLCAAIVIVWRVK